MTLLIICSTDFTSKLCKEMLDLVVAACSIISFALYCCVMECDFATYFDQNKIPADYQAC